MLMPGTFLDARWPETQEGRDVLATLTNKTTHQRKTFGLLERPSFPPQAAPDLFQYKIFVAGKSGVGKSCLVANLTGHPVSRSHIETAGIQTYTVYWPAKLIEIDKVIMFQLQFWDAGENAIKKFDHILPACKDRNDAVLLTFSFTDKSSFQDLPQLINRVTDGQDNVCKIAVGTKFDQYAHGEISQVNIRDFEQNYKIPILRTSNIPRMESGYNNLKEVTPILNSICEHLWHRDQILAGRLEPTETTTSYI